MRVPDVRFLDVGDVRLAWVQFGSGPDVDRLRDTQPVQRNCSGIRSELTWLVPRVECVQLPVARYAFEISCAAVGESDA